MESSHGPEAWMPCYFLYNIIKYPSNCSNLQFDSLIILFFFKNGLNGVNVSFLDFTTLEDIKCTKKYLFVFSLTPTWVEFSLF